MVYELLDFSFEADTMVCELLDFSCEAGAMVYHLLDISVEADAVVSQLLDLSVGVNPTASPWCASTGLVLVIDSFWVLKAGCSRQVHTSLFFH